MDPERKIKNTSRRKNTSFSETRRNEETMFIDLSISSCPFSTFTVKQDARLFTESGREESK